MMETIKEHPPYLDYPKERKKPTNADEIRQMTDEQLAQFLLDVVNYSCPPGMEFRTIFCGEYPDCKKCWLDWLRKVVHSDEPIHP